MPKYEFDTVRWLRNVAEVQSHRAGAGPAMLRENMLKCAEEIDALRARVARLEEALSEARLQIEYLHGKFKETGSGNAVLARIDSALGEK